MTHTKTHITGKDVALEDSITQLHGAIAALGFHIEEARWLNPVPNVWSVHIRDRDCPQVFSNGKGATREAALASAYGEMIERLSTRYLWADFMLDPILNEVGFVHQPDERWLEVGESWPEDWLDEHWHDAYVKENALTIPMLRDINGGGTGRGVCALPYVRQSDQRTCYIPVNMIANLFVSNGMSAGNNAAEAQVQGLSEIFERAIKNRIIEGAICLPQVPESVLATLPSIQAGLQALNEQGFHVRALDASLGGQYPVMAVVLQHSDGGVYASFGAHTQFSVALERALTELLQGRALGELSGFPAPTTDMEQVCDPHNIELHFIDSSGVVSWAILGDEPDVEFFDWHHQPRWSDDNETACEQLKALIHAEGHQVYVSEFTALGAYACRILVPGFSDIYLSDELVWQNNNQCLDVRAQLFDLHGAGEGGWQTLLDTFDTHNVNDQVRVFEWAGIAGDKETPWGRIRVGELRVWLALALGDRELAFSLLPSVLASGHLTEHERSQYRALLAVLELYMSQEADIEHTDGWLKPYAQALVNYYGQERLDGACAWLRGDVCFPDLDTLDARAPSLAHTRLLDAYKKVLAPLTTS